MFFFVGGISLLRGWVLRELVFRAHQRRRDDTKNKIFAFEGGNRPKNTVFRGKRHDNKILNVRILLSRNFVVIAQAPSPAGFDLGLRNRGVHSPRAQNLKFRAQNFDLHSSDPQRSGTPDFSARHQKHRKHLVFNMHP